RGFELVRLFARDLLVLRFVGGMCERDGLSISEPRAGGMTKARFAITDVEQRPAGRLEPLALTKPANRFLTAVVLHQLDPLGERRLGGQLGRPLRAYAVCEQRE